MDKRGILLSLIATAALLAGCAASQQRRNEEDLDRLVRWLPGTYENTAQAKADAQKGVRPPHDAVQLAIVPLGSVSVGRNSFYVQEMAADDPRRVLSQRVVLFSVTKNGIVESMAALVDPLRWRDGQRDPDVFLGMTPKDLNMSSGCELTWKRALEPAPDATKPSGAGAKKPQDNVRFVGANDPKRCQATSHVVPGMVEVELRAELTSNELAVAELQYGTNGQLIQGNKDEPFYRFRKAGSP
jgi:CpeT/CpcT family (DUF1001)